MARPLAKQLYVPFSQEEGMEEFLRRLVRMAAGPEHLVHEKYPAMALDLASSFRALRYLINRRCSHDSSALKSRGLLA